MKLTAYTFWITQTPMSEEEFEGYSGEWEWGQGKNRLRLGTEMEQVFSLETDEMKQLEDIKRRMDEWRKDGQVEAYEVVTTDGRCICRQQYMKESTKWGKKRLWQEVENFDLAYATVRFALTGKDY